MVNKADFTVFDTHHCPSLKTCINMIHTTVQA